LISIYQTVGISRDDFFAALGKELAVSEETVRRYTTCGVPQKYIFTHFSEFYEAVQVAVGRCINASRPLSHHIVSENWEKNKEKLLDILLKEREHFINEK